MRAVTPIPISRVFTAGARKRGRDGMYGQASPGFGAAESPAAVCWDIGMPPTVHSSSAGTAVPVAEA
jgi:hypothetical protein